jgi:3-hydroxyacyl-[acyl-carrier-protein] dehydratase
VSETIAGSETQARVDIGIDEILRLIPHRPPFLMIDSGEDFQPYRSMTGVKGVTMNEPFFAGHFPDYPVMPGVMIVEAIAQTGGVLMSKSMNLNLERKGILFMSVDNCRFRHPVRPGDTLRMPVEVLRARPEVARFKGRALVGDKLAAELEFTAVVVERG